jgi:hypothetical protein
MLTIPEEIQQLFLQKVETLLTTGETIQSQTTKKSTTEVRNADGELIKSINKVDTVRRTSVLPTPSFILTMVNDAMSLDRAVEICQKAGFLVLDPNEVPDENTRPRGISEETIELIKSKMLGFSSLEEAREVNERHHGN